MEMSDLLFEEPTFDHELNSNSPLRLQYALDTSDCGHLRRKRVNKWWQDWKYERNEILGRLRSDQDDKFESAIWELFLNSYFMHLGFKVERIQESQNVNTPDFLVSKGDRKYVVEASSIAKNKKAADIHWERFLEFFNKIKLDSYTASISALRFSNSTPKYSYFVRQMECLIGDIEFRAKSEIVDFPVKAIFSKNDWELEITIYKISECSKSIGIVGARTTNLVSVINDDKKLFRKIESKKSRYDKSGNPFILAILENSFASENDNFSRFNALFGHETINNTNGKVESGRKTNGIWGTIQKGKGLSGVLLLSRMQNFLPEFVQPYMYWNPYKDNADLMEDFPIDTYFLNGDIYEKCAITKSWDGF